VYEPVVRKEPAAKKMDTKDTPDKANFKTTKINVDSDSEGEGGLSLFERLNAKVCQALHVRVRLLWSVSNVSLCVPSCTSL
jgi:hypothetical protein